MIAKKETRQQRPSSIQLRVARTRIERKDGRQLRRFTVYLDADLAHQVAVHCATAEIGLSELFACAVAEYMRDVLNSCP
jgi:Ribbon-helix-helix protein, copG family